MIKRRCVIRFIFIHSVYSPLCYLCKLKLLLFCKASSTQTSLMYLYTYFCLVYSSELFIVVVQRFLISVLAEFEEEVFHDV